MKDQPKVFSAIAQVSTAMQAGIAKEKSAPQYKFRGVEDFLKAISPELTKAKLILLPSVSNQQINISERVNPASGNSPSKTQYVTKCTLDLTVTAVSLEDGSQTTFGACGEGQDYGDKATAKAISMAWKYLAIYAFCIPTENVEDTEQLAASVSEKDQSQEAKRLLVAIMEANDLDRLGQLEPYAAKHGLQDEWNNRKLSITKQKLS